MILIDPILSVFIIRIPVVCGIAAGVFDIVFWNMIIYNESARL